MVLLSWTIVLKVRCSTFESENCSNLSMPSELGLLNLMMKGPQTVRRLPVTIALLSGNWNRATRLESAAEKSPLLVAPRTADKVHWKALQN